MKISNKEKITKICIDDFAIKKGHTYGTIMIDIESHKKTLNKILKLDESEINYYGKSKQRII